MHVTDAFMAMSTHLHVCSTHIGSRIATTTATMADHRHANETEQLQHTKDDNFSVKSNNVGPISPPKSRVLTT